MIAIVDTIRLDAGARARGWPQALSALVIALAALLVPMWRPVQHLYDLWMTNESYGHGLLIVPIMLYVLWLQRQELLRFTPTPSYAGLAATAATMLLWFAARMLGIVMLEQLTLVAGLLAVVWAVLGFRVAWRAAPIIAYLMCAVPIWTYLTPMLQQHTAIASAAIVRALGVPVYLEGLYISIPEGRFVVAEVCSGMRYLLAGISLGGFYALLNLRSLGWQACLVAASFVLGIVFNWVRVAGIVLAGHLSDMQSSIVKSHVGFGWMLFLLVIVGILTLGRILEGVEARGARPRRSPEEPAPQAPRGMSAFLAAAAAIGALSLAPVALSASWLKPPQEPIALDLAALAQRGGWQPVSDVEQQWQPQFGGRDGDAFASFRKHDAGAPVDVFVAYYAVQRQDAEAVNDRNKNFDRQVWRRYALRPTADRVELAPGIDGEEYLIEIKEGATKRVVWRANWINGRFVTGTLEAKAQQFAGLLSGRRAAAALVLSTPVEQGEDQARTRLHEFAAANLPALLERLRTLSTTPAGRS